MASDSDQVRISVRIPGDLARSLERLAEEEDRTLSAELRRMIRQRVGSTTTYHSVTTI